MKDENKTKAQLIKELEEMRKKNVELETEKSALRHDSKRLKQEDDRFEQSLDLVGVLVINIEADETISLINRKGCEILGYKREELIRKNWFDLCLMEKDRERMRTEFKRVISGEIEPFKSGELSVITRGGEERCLLWHNMDLKNHDEKITGALCSAEDVTDRKRAEEILRTAEEKYRGIFENAIEGIYRTTPAGRFLEVNSAFARILGYDSPDALKNEITNIGQQLYTDPNVRKEWISFIDTQEYARFEVQMRRKDGTMCWVRLRAHPIRNEEGETIYYEGLAEDITERKQIEEELKQYRDHLEELVKERTGQLIESENKYRTIFENTGNATLIYDEDKKISLVNSEFERLFRYTRDEVEGKKSWTDLIPEEDFERLIEYHRLRGINPDAAPRNYELKVVDRFGHIRDVYMTVAMIPGTNKRVASLLDITPLKGTERALHESQMHYQALFDHAGVAIAELDAQGKHLGFNDSFVDFTGYTREELESMTGADVTHPDYIEATQNLRTKQINGEIDQFTMEQCYIHKDDTLRWGELRSTPLRDKQGKFLSAVVAITDITERKKAEEALAIKEALYRNLFEHAPIGMFQTNFEEGKFLRVNSAYAMMLGYESPEDLMSTLGDVATIHVTPEDRAILYDTLRKQDWFYGEYPRFRKDDSIMIGKVAIRRVLKPDGTIDYIEGIVEDITERKRAEEELKRYAEEVRDLYENAPCGYHSLGEDGTILRINDTELSWLGYSRDEVVSKMKYADLLTPEGMKTFQFNFPIFKKQGWISNLEFEFVRKDGGVFPILLNATAIYDDKGNYLMSRSSVFDNTERKRVEDALVENEALYRNLFENASIGMFQSTLEGRFLRINKAYATMLGYESPEEVIATITDTATQIHADPGNRAELLAALEEQGWFYAEQPYLRKDGSIMIGQLAVRKVDKQDGTTAYLEGIVEDITERKNAEDALEKYAAEITDLYENAPCGYHSLGEDGTYLRVNKTELAWLGYSREEMIGKMKLPDLLTPEEKETFQQKFSLFKKQGWASNHEYNFIRKDGSTFPVLINATAVLDENGNYLMSRGSLFDNTERKQAEDALLENEALYRNLFENASIGMFQSTLEGRFLRINKAYATMLGYESPEEAIATITDTATQIHADPGNRAELLAALEEQGWFYAEQPYLRKDGSIMIGQLAVRKVDKQDGTTAYLEGIVEDITKRKQTQDALVKSERELRIKAQDLMDTNTTLKVLLNTMENDQEELKERFLDNIKTQILPYFKELKKRPLKDVEKGLIQMAEENLNDIASPFVQKLTSSYLNLTKKEIQIAELVKDGKTSKEIAQILDASQRVIEFHRENIRRKLGLKKKKGSLAMLLRSFS